MVDAAPHGLLILGGVSSLQAGLGRFGNSFLTENLIGLGTGTSVSTSFGGGMGIAVSKRDTMAGRDELQWRAVACARAGHMIQAMVWGMAADMCRAAWWSERLGAAKADRLVALHCQRE
jgi:hypothetical protein